MTSAWRRRWRCRPTTTRPTRPARCRCPCCSWEVTRGAPSRALWSAISTRGLWVLPSSAPPPSAGLTSGGSVYGQPLDKLAAEQVCESGKICPSGDFGVATLAALCLALAAGCFVRAGQGAPGWLRWCAGRLPPCVGSGFEPRSQRQVCRSVLLWLRWGGYPLGSGPT